MDSEKPTSSEKSDEHPPNTILGQRSPTKTKQTTITKNDSGISFQNPLSADRSFSCDEETWSDSPKTTSENSSPDSGLQPEAISGMSAECEDTQSIQSVSVSSDNITTNSVNQGVLEDSSDCTPFNPDLDDVSMSNSATLPGNRVDIPEDALDNDSKISDSDQECSNVTPKSKRPIHKWFACKEVLMRQYGNFGNKSNDLFRQRCCSSLHMVERLELMYKMEKHKGCVNALHFNETGTRLVSGSDDLKVIIWDWTISQPVLTYDSGHKSNIFQAKFLPLSGDSHIISCSRDGQVRLAELSSTGVCKKTRRLAQHNESCHKLSLESDSPHCFLSCGEDGVVYLIDVRSGKPEKLLLCKEDDKRIPFYTIHSNPVKSCDFAVGGKNKYLRIYDKRFIKDSEASRKYCPHNLVDKDVNANITCLVYNYNGTEILVSYNDDDIYTFNESHSDRADSTHRYFGHRNNQTVKGVNYYGPNSEFIVSGSDCGNIFFWEHDTEHIVQYMHGDEGGVVNCLEPHPNCPILATSGLDRDVKIWVPSCEEPPTLEGLNRVVSKNMKNREEERNSDSQDDISEQVLMFLMRQGRMSARRRISHLLDSDTSSSSSSDNNEDDNDSSNDDDRDRDRRNIQCYQS